MSFVKHFNFDYCTLECKESSASLWIFIVDFKSLLVFDAHVNPFSTVECFKLLFNLTGLPMSATCKHVTFPSFCFLVFHCARWYLMRRFRNVWTPTCAMPLASSMPSWIATRRWMTCRNAFIGVSSWPSSGCPLTRSPRSIFLCLAGAPGCVV